MPSCSRTAYEQGLPVAHPRASVRFGKNSKKSISHGIFPRGFSLIKHTTRDIGRSSPVSGSKCYDSHRETKATYFLPLVAQGTRIGNHSETCITLSYAIAPVGYQVILEPGMVQVREFESPRGHTRTNLLGLSLVHRLTCGKRESVS